MAELEKFTLRDVLKIPYEERLRRLFNTPAQQRFDLYQNGEVMDNKLGEVDVYDLAAAEKTIVNSNMRSLEREMQDRPIELSRKGLMDLNKRIFGDIYEWAGHERFINVQKTEPLLNGNSVDYEKWYMIRPMIEETIERMKAIDYKTDPKHGVEELTMCFAELWRCHPFREGNTRTTTTFAWQAAVQNGLDLNYMFTTPNGVKLRDALVLANDPAKQNDDSRYNILFNILASSVRDVYIPLKPVPQDINLNVAKQRMENDLKNRNSSEKTRKPMQQYTLRGD